MASKTWSAERILLTEAAEPVDVVDFETAKEKFLADVLSGRR
jgi:hypothetical protein